MGAGAPEERNFTHESENWRQLVAKEKSAANVRARSRCRRRPRRRCVHFLSWHASLTTRALARPAALSRGCGAGVLRGV